MKMWYDVLCEELPQKNEEGEYSVDGVDKSFDTRSDLKNYLSQPSTPVEKFSEGVITKDDIKQKISNQSPYGKSTVKQLIRLGKLPHKILILLKTTIRKADSILYYPFQNYNNNPILPDFGGYST